MENIIKIGIIFSLIVITTACFHDDELLSTSSFLYYGGDENPDAIVFISGRQYARRAYFECDQCEEEYENRYIKDGKWLWDQKTCRQEEEALDSSALYCLRDVLVNNFDVTNERYLFSDAGCDFVVPIIGEPISPGSEKLQRCEFIEEVSNDVEYCSTSYVALDQEDTCSFSIIDAAL